MVRLFSTRKESPPTESARPMSSAVDPTDTADSETKRRSIFQTFKSRIFSRSHSPHRTSADKRPAVTEDPEPYYYEEEDDIMAFKTPLRPVPESHVEAEASKRTDTPGFTAYYLRFDPARRSNPPPALPPLDRPLSTIPEVDTPSICDPGPSREPPARMDYSNQTCPSCGLHFLDCAKSSIPSGANPSKGLNLSIYVDEIDCVRLANHVRKRSKKASHDTGEGETHILMYLNHRHEPTDKRVEVRVGFDKNVTHEDRKVVAFLCEFKKSQIISYLGPHATRLRSGARVPAYLYDSKGPTMFGVTVGHN